MSRGRFYDLDIVHIANEIADVTRREYDLLESDLARVMQHLPKRYFHAERRSRSWVNLIKPEQS